MSAKEEDLLAAAASGDIATIQRIIDTQKSIDLNYQNEGSLSALHKAAEHGHTDVIDLLLQNSATIEARTKDMRTPLHLAAQAGHVACVNSLLLHQAGADQLDAQGNTPLMLASVNGHVDVVQALLVHLCGVKRVDKDGRTALHLSCESGHKEISKILVLWGAEIERGDKNGLTALMYAARAGHADIVAFLVECNAAIDKTCQAGLTALMYATKEGQLVSAECLCNNGADIHLRNKMGRVALQLAVEAGRCDVTEFLINRDSDTSELTKTGQSLVMLAATLGHTDIVALLVLEEGADVDQVNAMDGNTALHYASLAGRSETVRFLLTQCHADATIVNKDNQLARSVVLNAETREAFSHSAGASTVGKSKEAWGDLIDSSASAGEKSQNGAHRRHQRLLREGQHLLARFVWIKKRDILHADVQTVRKSNDFQLVKSREGLLFEHKQTSSRIGIRESRYYTYPERLLQSYFDLEASPRLASAMSSAELSAALYAKLQVLSQQRAGKEDNLLKNALTEKIYTTSELLLEIGVLQQALSVPRLNPSTVVSSLPYGRKLVYEKELNMLFSQLEALNGTHESAKMAEAPDTTGSGSAVVKWLKTATQLAPQRVYSVAELTQGIAELTALTKSVCKKIDPPVLNPKTTQPYTIEELAQRVNDLQHALSGAAKISSVLPAPKKLSISKGEAEPVSHFNNTLRLLSKVRKECPSIVWFYPKNTMHWVNDPDTYLFKGPLMMVFVCPVTLRVVKCGPEGTGWEVREPKVFLKKIMPVVLVSLFVMQAAALEGLKVRIPLGWQKAHISVPAARIPSLLMETALDEAFDVDHLMSCLSSFSGAMERLNAPSNTTMQYLFVQTKRQHDRYKRTKYGATLSSIPEVTLGTELSPATFERSYMGIISFLTSEFCERFGRLEEQLRGLMERVVSPNGDVEWVSLGGSQEWLRIHMLVNQDAPPSTDGPMFVQFIPNASTFHPEGTPRAIATMETVEKPAVDGFSSDMQCNHTLHLLLSKVQKECPSIVWFYPQNIVLWEQHPVRYLQHGTLMMVFVCPVTMRVVNCGPRGTGWEVRRPKEFLTRIMPVVLISLYVMQAAVLEGRKVLIPFALESASAFDARRKHSRAPSLDPFDANKLINSLSFFANAVKKLPNSSDSKVQLLFRKVHLQQKRYTKMTKDPTLFSSVEVPLVKEVDPAMFEESYKRITSFLTSEYYERFGGLEHQLRWSMERVRAPDGDAEWVGKGRRREWLQMRALCVSAESSAQKGKPTSVTTNSTIPVSSADKAVLSADEGKGQKNEAVTRNEQELLAGEEVDGGKEYAEMPSEELTASLLREVGITSIGVQRAPIPVSVREDIGKEFASFTISSPTNTMVSDAEIQRKLQVIYEEFAAQKKLSAAERLARDGYIRPATSGNTSRQHLGSPAAPPASGPSADGGNDGDDGQGGGGSGIEPEPCCKCCDDMTLIAAGKGHFTCLKYAIRHYPIHADACTAAAAGDFVRCLHLLREKGATWTEDTTRAAVTYGCLDALHYLLDYDCPRSDNLMLCAAEGGRRDCLRYLVEERQMELSAEVFGAAFERAHSDCVEYLVDVGCPTSGYAFKAENEWYICRGYHAAANADERFLRCILWAVDHAWSRNNDGLFECPNLVGYIFDNANILPLCNAHIIAEGWQA